MALRVDRNELDRLGRVGGFFSRSIPIGAGTRLNRVHNWLDSETFRANYWFVEAPTVVDNNVVHPSSCCLLRAHENQRAAILWPSSSSFSPWTRQNLQPPKSDRRRPIRRSIEPTPTPASVCVGLLRRATRKKRTNLPREPRRRNPVKKLENSMPRKLMKLGKTM